MEDQAGNERLGFLVPMRLAGHARFIEHEGVGQGACIFRDIEAGRVELVERIEGGRGLAGDAEGVEDMDRAELLAGAAGDLGIFALGVDADHGAVGGEQVGDDGSHALAGARRCHRQQMGRAVIAQELSGLPSRPISRPVSARARGPFPCRWRSGPSRGFRRPYPRNG
jgi:hypothetical protein